MKEIAIHSATIGAGTLRFFRPQRGGPDFPWVDYSGLLICLGVSRALRARMRNECKEGPFKRDFVSIETEAGLALLAPHYAAQGTIDAMVGLGECHLTIRAEYDMAGCGACSKITVGMSPEELADFLAAATRKNDVGFSTKMH